MKINRYKDQNDGIIKYKFSIYLGIDNLTNKPKRTTRKGFLTKEEAVKEYQRIYNLSNPEKYKKTITFEQVFKDWFQIYITTVKKSTQNTTFLLFKNHILPKFGNAIIIDITYKDLQEFTLSISKKLKNYREIISYIRNVFNHAIRLGIIEDNPANLIIFPKVKFKPIKDYNFYEYNELKEFLKCCKKDLDEMWYLFFHLVSYTGIRKGEALALTWKDINFDEKYLNINKTITRSAKKQIVDSPKSQDSYRTIYLDVATINLLRSWKMNQEDIYEEKINIVFSNTTGSYLTSSFPLKKMNYVIKKNKLKKVSVHGLRHSHASMLFEAGVEPKIVQKRLGHSKYETTINTYTHVYNSKEKYTIEKALKSLNI